MDRNRKDEQARVHNAHGAQSVRVLSKSPTQTADEVKERQQLSKSFSAGTSRTVHMSQMPEKQQTTFSACKEDSCAQPKHQSDVMKGDMLTITVKQVDAEKKEHEFTMRRSCTVEEYMKWKFILSQPAHLDQFNVNMMKELGISGAITSDAVMYFNERLNSSQNLKDTCDRLVNYAMDHLGKGLRVNDIAVKPNQVGMYIKQITKITTFAIYAEVIQEQLYVVFLNRDQKHVTEYIRKLVEGESKQRDISDRIVARTIWNKMAYLINLDKVLEGYCPTLEITFTREQDKFVISLNGPETAVDTAKQEFAQINDNLLREKCNINVTSKYVLPELQVENFLDEHLSKQGLICATCQAKEGIYVYGFKDAFLKAAKTEIESIIKEKPCFVTGCLKAKTGILVSYVKCKWPGLVVIHIGESGYLRIVGVKQCVDDTHQIISDLMNGKIELEDLPSRQTNKKVKTETENAAAETQTDEDGSQVGRENKQYATRIHASEKEERPREHSAGIRKDSLDERKTKKDLRKNQKRTMEIGRQTNDGTERRMADITGYIPVTDEGSLKHTDGNTCTKEDVQDSHRKKQKNKEKYQEVLEASMIYEQRNLSKTKESEDRTLKYIDENTYAKEEVDNACSKKQKNTEEPQIEQHRNISKTKESETISECMDFFDKKICQFLTKPDSRTFLSQCANENNVMIHQYINRGVCIDEIVVKEDAVIIPNLGLERTIKWKTTEQKKMMLTMKRKVEDMLERGCRFVLVKFKEHRHESELISTKLDADKKVTVTIRIPKWINEKGHGIEKLTDLLTQFTEAIQGANTDHVIIPLETVGNWPTSDFVPCVVSKFVEDIFLNTRLKKPHVILCLDDGTHFDRVFMYTDKCIRKCLKDQQAKHSQLKVSVIAGELDNTKVDVIVNTTSRDLDLSNGKVSAAILKAAGSGIQKECRKSYPNGISRHDIAVTGGHSLTCKNVFHIALDRYIANREMNSIESIRSLVFTCLQTASDMKHKTIAFPAIGTGVLKYPIDLVAAAMFESVERFKSMHTDTSLTTVFFVIYPSDVKVMKMFRKNEETLGKPPEIRGGKQGTEVKITLSGQPENVSKAKACVFDRCEDELYDPSDIFKKSFPGATYQVYLVVWYWFKEEIKPLSADCIKIDYQNDTIYLSGKRKELKRASEKIKGYIDKINSQYHFASVSVQRFNTQDVEEEVHQANEKKDVVCIFEKFKDIVYICAKSPGKASRVGNLFTEKLVATCSQLYSKPTSVKDKLPDNECGSRKSVCGEQTQEENLSDRNRTFSSSNKRKEIKERLRTKRQFSWTQHVNNCKSFQIDKCMVRVYEADILCLHVECIVNPANKNLDHHGGLASTIAKAAGITLERESADIVKSKGGSLPVTSVVCTTAGELNYKCILHAVGPCWYDYSPDSKEKIKECLNDLRLTVINCFIHAEQNGIETIVLPTISSGLFGVPKELCAIQYAEAIQQFSSKSGILKEIHIVDISHDMIDIVQRTFDAMLVHGKTIIVDMNSYIKRTGTPSKYTDDVTAGFKNTGRDKPGSLKTSDQTKSVVKNTDRNEEKYEEEGSKLVCTFSSNHVVQVYESNILKLKEMHALVCSDNRRGEANGEVSQQLLEINGKGYEAEKAELFKTKRNYGEVITTSGGKSNFKHIIHAITPTKDIKALHMMYFNIFEEVMKKRIRCLAIPLLGTGTGKFGPDEGAEVLLMEWVTFCNKAKGHPLTMHLVLREKSTSDLVKDIFRKHIDGNTSSTPSAGEDFKHEGVHSDEKRADVDNDIASEDTEENCVICMDKVSVPKKLKCGHTFCTECIEGYFRVKTACPTCGQVCGVIIGDQPDGRVEIVKIEPSCAGYEGHRTLAVSYYFPSGLQGEEHPRPGSHYRSISRTGYLPDTKEGREICALLKVAFERRLVFTIGTSRTTGEEGVITWNDIHHKTDMRPNTQFGYPDKTYLQRVREELAVKGVTEIDIEENFVKELKADTFRHTVSTDTTL